MSDQHLVDQLGRPIAIVRTPQGARARVLGEALPPAQRGAGIYVDPEGGGQLHGDFRARHPNSGPAAKHKPAAPKTPDPTDNATLGRVYTMAMPPPPRPANEHAEPQDGQASDSAASPSVEVLKGYAEGLVVPAIEAAKLAAEGLGHIVTQPIETGKALVWGTGKAAGMVIDGWGQIVSAPGEALDAFRWAGGQALEKLNQTLSGNPREAGKLVGEIVGAVVPVGAAARAARKPKPKPEPTPAAAPTSGVVIVRPRLRQEYVDRVNALKQKIEEMRKAGMSSEDIARAAHAERRAIGEQFKALTPPDKLAEIHQRNLQRYGDKLGPSIDWLRAQDKSWDQIIASATRTGGKDLGF